MPNGRSRTRIDCTRTYLHGSCWGSRVCVVHLICFNVGLHSIVQHARRYSTIDPNHPSHTLLCRMFSPDHHHLIHQQWARTDQEMHRCSSARTHREPFSAERPRNFLGSDIKRKRGQVHTGWPRVIVRDRYDRYATRFTHLVPLYLLSTLSTS